MAPYHYHKDVIKFLNENKVPFVQKLENPPNCPEIRSVEKFWSLLKQKVYQNNWEATNTQSLIRKIKKEAKTFDINYCQRLFRQAKTNVRKAADYGLSCLLFIFVVSINKFNNYVVLVFRASLIFCVDFG